jgi:hypothetical protein
MFPKGKKEREKIVRTRGHKKTIQKCLLVFSALNVESNSIQMKTEYTI